MVKRKLNEEELEQLKNVINYLKEEISDLEHELKNCDFMLQEKLDWDYKKSVKAWAYAKTDIENKINNCKDRIALGEEQILNGVEIKELKNTKKKSGR